MSQFEKPLYFLITIDTEGDNLWGRPRVVTTRNSEFLPRFQSLCERYRFKPTYLTDVDMARCPRFVEFARDAERRGVAEVGMHLHAWNTPPHHRLTEDDDRFHPYLIEYPEELIRAKVKYVTGLLEEAFGHAMRCHRAGRWAFNSTYAKVLVEHGYLVDCSVTPYISWERHGGAPQGIGGTDYRRFPSDAYLVDLDELSRQGTSSLLEVPMTIVPNAPRCIEHIREMLPQRSLPRRVLGRLLAPPSWFRPMRGNRAEMLRIIKVVRAEERKYIEFMLHSSEFMPGGSPAFPDDAAIEQLYDDLEAVFSSAASCFQGATLSEFRAATVGKAEEQA
jgi:hypothetical protein